MAKKVVLFSILDKLDRGKIRVYGMLAKQRPAYTNNEIALLLNEKMTCNKDTINKMSETYNVDKKTIDYMLKGKVEFSIKMLRISSDYLNIPFDGLTRLIQDDDKFNCRAGSDCEDTEDVFDIINYIFSETIRQKRLAKSV